MIRKRASFLVMLVLMIFMELKVNAKSKDEESPFYTRYVAEVTAAFAKEMHKKYGLECGASGGRMPYDVEEISVSLVSSQNATVEQARELEIRATERFIQIINAHEKIRPFLREYPFPPSRADVSISFRPTKKMKNLSIDKNMSLVFQAKNRIFYRSINPDNQYVLNPIQDESYEEALKIVQENTAKNSLQNPKDL